MDGAKPRVSKRDRHTKLFNSFFCNFDGSVNRSHGHHVGAFNMWIGSRKMHIGDSETSYSKLKVNTLTIS